MSARTSYPTAGPARIVALPADPPELFGWNAKLLPTLVPSQLEIIDPQKTTSHRAKITVPRLPEYYIASPETVLVTLPASAVRSGQTVVASPVFEIRPATPVAVIDAPDFEYEDEFGDTVRTSGHIEGAITRNLRASRLFQGVPSNF